MLGWVISQEEFQQFSNKSFREMLANKENHERKFK